MEKNVTDFLANPIHYQTEKSGSLIGCKRSRNNYNGLMEQREKLQRSHRSIYSGLVVYDVI